MSLKPKEISAASREASRRTGVNARHFEKDYYVTSILRQIFSDAPNSVVFKGGTSLSKAYDLIQRFSEDVDLLVVPQLDDAENVEKILNQIDDSCSKAMSGMSPEVRDQKYGLMREVWLKPHYGTEKGGGVLSQVIVESGRRGGPRPTEVRKIRPWLADVIDQLASDEDFSEFEVTVLHPARTLVEKLFIVNKYGQNLTADPDYKISSRLARHFYDIFRLLSTESPAIAHLKTSGDLTEIVRDSERITKQYFDNPFEPFEGSFASATIFADTSLVSRIEPALLRSCEELCYPDAPTPSWAEVVAAVNAHSEVLTVKSLH